MQPIRFHLFPSSDRNLLLLVLPGWIGVSDKEKRAAHAENSQTKPGKSILKLNLTYAGIREFLHILRPLNALYTPQFSGIRMLQSSISIILEKGGEFSFSPILQK